MSNQIKIIYVVEFPFFSIKSIRLVDFLQYHNFHIIRLVDFLQYHIDLLLIWSWPGHGLDPELDNISSTKNQIKILTFFEKNPPKPLSKAVATIFLLYFWKKLKLKNWKFEGIQPYYISRGYVPGYWDTESHRDLVHDRMTAKMKLLPIKLNLPKC